MRAWPCPRLWRIRTPLARHRIWPSCCCASGRSAARRERDEMLDHRRDAGAARLRGRLLRHAARHRHVDKQYRANDLRHAIEGLPRPERHAERACLHRPHRQPSGMEDPEHRQHRHQDRHVWGCAHRMGRPSSGESTSRVSAGKEVTRPESFNPNRVYAIGIGRYVIREHPMVPSPADGVPARLCFSLAKTPEFRASDTQTRCVDLKGGPPILDFLREDP